MLWQVYIHKQVMPESCRHLTASQAHSHPCLISLLFIPSLYSILEEFSCLVVQFMCRFNDLIYIHVVLSHHAMLSESLLCHSTAVGLPLPCVVFCWRFEPPTC